MVRDEPEGSGYQDFPILSLNSSEALCVSILLVRTLTAIPNSAHCKRSLLQQIRGMRALKTRSTGSLRIKGSSRIF